MAKRRVAVVWQLAVAGEIRVSQVVAVVVPTLERIHIRQLRARMEGLKGGLMARMAGLKEGQTPRVDCGFLVE